MVERLTKIVTDKKGEKCVTCVLHGTNECKSTRGCYRCPTLAAMLARLYALECLYLEDIDNERHISADSYSAYINARH